MGGLHAAFVPSTWSRLCHCLFHSNIYMTSGCRWRWWMSWPVHCCSGAFSSSDFVSSYWWRTTLTCRHWIVDFLLWYVDSSFAFLSMCISTLFSFLAPSSRILATSLARFDQMYYHSRLVRNYHLLPTHDAFFIKKKTISLFLSRLLLLPSPHSPRTHSMCLLPLVYLPLAHAFH